MKATRTALLLLSLSAGVMEAGPATASPGILPDNLADCLRATGDTSPALSGCEDFFAILHTTAPQVERQYAGAAPARTPLPLARPAGTGEQKVRSPLQRTAMARPLTRPEPPCARGAAHFLQGRGPLERDGEIRYAAEAESGDARVAFAVPPYCHIESPLAGEVVFAGTFAGYGGTVILLDKGGNHIVLAGFDDLHVSRGETLPKGATLGRVAPQRPEALASMFAAANGALLYLEIRPRTGKADPVEWLAGKS